MEIGTVLWVWDGSNGRGGIWIDEHGNTVIGDPYANSIEEKEEKTK